MWVAAPVMISLTAYFIYMMMPTPVLFIPPIIPTHNMNYWNWS